ncbi:MAG: aminoacetone oxidase family FAD-binding enzyme [Candidatus Uhrbacteria bacterium]|nr:aminoacetone oxidase family FAD-binding enzyme [Candidatus Uhrbacteria bacterium]
MKRFDVIVIGGGAAGMIAAGCAAARGKRVLMLEKNNTVGEKLIITGGGRCNITNAEFNERLLLKNYGKAAPFLFSAFSQFGVQDTFDFFESLGLPLVVQEGNRAFPKTERATDVRRVLEKYMKNGGVTVKTGARVTRIQSDGSRVTGVDASGDRYEAGAVIIATGGTSHPETGSTGDGFAWLRELGHTVHTPTPSIVPLEVFEKSIRDLAGVSIPGVKISYYLNDKKEFSRKGNLLFTHFGISGPVVLNSSGKVGDLLHEGKVVARIDFFPEENERELDDRIIALFDENKNKVLRNIFNLLAPHQLLFCMKGISGEEKVHSVTKEQRGVIVHTLKAIPLTITRLMGLDRAVVVDGGVDMKEIHNKTMRSTLYDNLYIVGDLLDINRPSGGYSLQLCWTTGWVAGSSA